MAHAKSEIIETSNLQDVMFPVRKVETELTTGMVANSDYSHTIIATTPQGDKHVNFCSDTYELVPVSDFAPSIRQIVMNAGLEFTENYRMINNAVIYGELIIKDKRYYVGKPEDYLQMRITWSHSYNGLEQYELNMGTFKRYKCTNGLWMTKFDTETYGLVIVGKHTQKIRTSLQSLQNKLQYVLENDVMRKAVETYQPLYDNWVGNWEDRVLEVMKVASIGTTKNNLDKVNDRIRLEASDLYGGEVNDWLIYNGINYFLFNDDNNSAFEHKRRAKDQKVLVELLKG